MGLGQGSALGVGFRVGVRSESELLSRSASLQVATPQLQIGDRSRLRLPFLVKHRLRLRHGSPKRIGCRTQSRTLSSSRSLSRHQDVPRRQVPSFGCGIGFGILGVGIGVRSGIEVGVEIDVGISVGVSAVRFLDEASASLSESAGQIVRSSGRRVIG